MKKKQSEILCGARDDIFRVMETLLMWRAVTANDIKKHPKFNQYWDKLYQIDKEIRSLEVAIEMLDEVIIKEAKHENDDQA